MRLATQNLASSTNEDIIMKTLKLLALAAFVLLFSQCKTTAPSTPVASNAAVLEVIQILDTLQHHFYDLAKSSVGSTPGQVVLKTADWLKTQPNVKQVNWYDSLHIVVTMNSGLQANSIFNLVNDKGISISRGGAPSSSNGNRLLPTSKNKITNKNILIYSPFGGCGNKLDFLQPAEVEQMADIFRNANKDFNVTVLTCDMCTVKAIESFKDYGLVIIDTHGLPNGFLTGDVLPGLWKLYQKDIDGLVLAVNEKFGFDGFHYFTEGAYSFCALRNINFVLDWQSFLNDQTAEPQLYQIVVHGKFINSLESMPNTVIFGNMCYSGWNNSVFVQLGQQIPILEPIRNAFMKKELLSYYAYGFPDGTATTVENDFALKMEEYLIRAFAEDDDSTGNAHLPTSGKEYTEGQFLSNSPNPTLPLRHYGYDDYSFNDCIKEFTDDRDGETYKAVCIGRQKWMAENLRYNAPGSKCYDSLPANCETLGKLYPWVVAMGGVAATNANPSMVQGICPKGWHLPSEAEWDELFTAVGGRLVAGTQLKVRSPLWDSWGGEDNSVGFTAIPGGLFTFTGGTPDRVEQYALKNRMGLFLSTSVTNGKVVGLAIQSGSPTVTDFPVTNTIDPNQPPMNASCRCVKDTP